MTTARVQMTTLAGGGGAAARLLFLGLSPYPPSATVIAAAVMSSIVEGTTTVTQSLRLHNGVLAGKVSGAGTGTEIFRDLADTKDRVTATVESVGNRTAVVRDVT